MTQGRKYYLIFTRPFQDSESREYDTPFGEREESDSECMKLKEEVIPRVFLPRPSG